VKVCGVSPGNESEGVLDDECGESIEEDDVTSVK